MNNGISKNGVSYLTRLEHFRQIDKERDDLLKDLVAKYQDLEQRFEKKCQEYDNEVQTRGIYQAQANEATKTLTDIQHRMAVNSFVIAIVDGDGAVFRDDWIMQGEDGGAMAAHQLRADIKKYLKESYPDINVEPWHIIVQVVLNLDGLSRKLYSVELTTSTNDLPAFARGFSRAQGLFSFVDVGKGKEQADFKVRETLRLMVHNLQCKHIIFGPCHDKGYIVELRPYQLETSVSNKITLLETTIPPREFSELAFHRVKFTNVFRSELLPDGPPITTSSLPAPKPANYATVTSSWSSTIPFVNNFKRLTGTPEKPAKPAKLPTGKYYVTNSLGHRIDEPLPRADADSERSFKDRGDRENRGPCNRYHINGVCEDIKCTYYHGERFGPGEQLVLRNKARGTFCFHKGACKNADCVWGHHCKYGGGKCVRSNCAFITTHDMDLTPAKRIYEDGSVVIISH